MFQRKTDRSTTFSYFTSTDSDDSSSSSELEQLLREGRMERWRRVVGEWFRCSRLGAFLRVNCFYPLISGMLSALTFYLRTGLRQLLTSPSRVQQ